MEHEQSLSFTCMHVYSTGRWLNISENQIPLVMANPSASPNVVWTSYAAPQVRNAYRLGMLSRMDVSISWEKKRERGDWRTQVGVYNVTNRVNPYAAIWSETDDGEPFIEEIGLIPFAPQRKLVLHMELKQTLLLGPWWDWCRVIGLTRPMWIWPAKRGRMSS